jgi:hypothetical protein
MGTLVGAGEPGFIVRNTFKLDDAAFRPWHTYRLDLQVRMACRFCNNGWMSDLETKVRPVVKSMIRGDARVPILFRDQVAVTRWAVKTAMVVEFLQKPQTRYFTPSERRSVMTDSVPSRSLGVFVWLGRYASKNDGLHGLATTMLQADPLSRAHLSTFALGQFVIQVLVERGAAGQFERLPVRPGLWHRMLYQIWPPSPILEASGTLLFWPPPISISAGVFDALFDRFLIPGTKRGSDGSSTTA